VARGVNGASSLSGICCHCHSSIPVSEYSCRFTIQLGFLLHILHFPLFYVITLFVITRETRNSKSLNVNFNGVLDQTRFYLYIVRLVKEEEEEEE